MTQMSMSDVRKTAVRKLREAERARDELSAALRSAGIVLPSLGVDPLAYGDENPDPLLDLGRCSRTTARKLTAALQNRAGVCAAGPLSGEDADAT